MMYSDKRLNTMRLGRPGGIGQLIRRTIAITIRERNRKANPVNQLSSTGENIMVKVYLRYIRYTLSMLATVGFGINLGN